MVVKELYTESAVVGHAAMLRQDSGWLYYCTWSESGRCYGDEKPNEVTYGGDTVNCACHATGDITTASKIPLP